MLYSIPRTILSLFLGLFAISILVESLEFVVVAIANGAVTTDPEIYVSVRNQTWILIGKLFYNSAGAFVGGYLAARLAEYAPLKHGAALAVIQTLAFVWALSQPEIRITTPDWMWALLIPLTAVAIVMGGLRCQQRVACDEIPQQAEAVVDT